MDPVLLRRRVDVDPLQLAARWADRPGTLLLHTQRDWNGSGRSALLFSPRWTLRYTHGEAPHWNGALPDRELRLDDPVSAPLHWARLWSSARRSEPVFAGVAGMIGYDLGAAALGGRHAESPPFDLPDLWLGAYDLALVFDARRSGAELHAADLSPLVAQGPSLEARWEEGLDQIRDAMEGPPPLAQRTGVEDNSDPRFFDRSWHRQAVLAVQERLRAGDSYQINLTGLARARSSVSPWAAFLDQAERNPVAFAAHLRVDDRTTVTSHSPERLLRLRGPVADTAPIKGTRRVSEDSVAALRASAKDRAEHVMIVDLCRNDLGRHAKVGSVEVTSLMESLEMDGLVHMVSRIEARLTPRARRHALADLFPGGSITGAPKRSSVQIIADLEQHQRGLYTGSVGFVDRAGHADWNIAIRTAVWQNHDVFFGCGGGIVIDSDPDLEYEEAVLKASSFFESLRALASPEAQPSSPPREPLR